MLIVDIISRITAFDSQVGKSASALYSAEYSNFYETFLASFQNFDRVHSDRYTISARISSDSRLTNTVYISTRSLLAELPRQPLLLNTRHILFSPTWIFTFRVLTILDGSLINIRKEKFPSKRKRGNSWILEGNDVSLETRVCHWQSETTRWSTEDRRRIGERVEMRTRVMETRDFLFARRNVTIRSRVWLTNKISQER